MKIAILFGLFLIVVISGIVYAVNDEEDAAQTATEPTAKNMTYGQCVSQNAIIKNSCYSAARSTLEACKNQTAQDAARKDATKQCKQDYKQDKKQCKVVFKASKKECAKIKHNFLETIGSSLK